MPSMQPASKLERRMVTAAEQALRRQRYVSPLDVLTGMGWVPLGLVTDWRQGWVPYLEAVAAVSADRLADALEVFRRWVAGRGLRPSQVDYLATTRDRRPLRFTAAGDLTLELTYRTQWTPADLPERLTARQSKPPDLVVVQPLKAFTYVGCGRIDADMLMMEDAGPVCLTCADLDHLVFLPAGDAALTRRAKRLLTWSRPDNRHRLVIPNDTDRPQPAPVGVPSRVGKAARPARRGSGPCASTGR